jgi:hypothetical protein
MRKARRPNTDPNVAAYDAVARLTGREEGEGRESEPKPEAHENGKRLSDKEDQRKGG